MTLELGSIKVKFHPGGNLFWTLERSRQAQIRFVVYLFEIFEMLSALFLQMSTIIFFETMVLEMFEMLAIRIVIVAADHYNPIVII